MFRGRGSRRLRGRAHLQVIASGSDTGVDGIWKLLSRKEIAVATVWGGLCVAQGSVASMHWAVSTVISLSERAMNAGLD